MKKKKKSLPLHWLSYISFVMRCINVDDKRYIYLIQVVACEFMKLPMVMHHN